MEISKQCGIPYRWLGLLTILGLLVSMYLAYPFYTSCVMTYRNPDPESDLDICLPLGNTLYFFLVCLYWMGTILIVFNLKNVVTFVSRTTYQPITLVQTMSFIGLVFWARIIPYVGVFHQGYSEI